MYYQSMFTRFKILTTTFRIQFYRYLTEGGKEKTNGLLIGVPLKDNKPQLTPCGRELDSECKGALMRELTRVRPIEQGEIRMYWNMIEDFTAICAVGLGDCSKQNEHDDKDKQTDTIHLRREHFRTLTAEGCKQLMKHNHIQNIYIDGIPDILATGEGALLSTWRLNLENIEEVLDQPSTTSHLLNNDRDKIECFKKGAHRACAQNTVRALSSIPPSFINPQNFILSVENQFNDEDRQHVDFKQYDSKWIESHMPTFGEVIKETGTENTLLWELTYATEGTSNKRPCAIIGQGSIDNPHSHFYNYYSQAIVAALIHAIARMKLPIHIVGYIPLVETARFPIHTTVQSSNDDLLLHVNAKHALDRVILTNVLSQAMCQDPVLIIDITTVAAREKNHTVDDAFKVFSNNDKIFKLLRHAGAMSGERMHRLPLWDAFLPRKRNGIIPICDEKHDTGSYVASLLEKFIKPDTIWMHWDVSSVVQSRNKKDPYFFLPNVTTGRPMRTLLTFIEMISCKCYQKKK